MKNYWLGRFKIGKRVRYKGRDKDLEGKFGYVVSINGEWIDVRFEFSGLFNTTRVVCVEKNNLEIM